MIANHRTADHDIDPLFLERWSPRAFDESSLSEEQVLQLLEAARWAPSSYNMQPWRFVYARRDTPAWDRLLGLLIPRNAEWVARASVLFLVASDTLMQLPGADELKPSHTHSFDAGSAWALLALQATRMGLQAHGMIGLDLDRAASELAIPERYRVEAMIAVGRQADAATLPEGLRSREHPSDRRPIASFAREGAWPA